MLELKSLEEALEYKAPPQAQVAVIESVCKTPGSDRLGSYGVFGWTVISSNINQTGESFGDFRYSPGAKIIYIAIDSIIEEKLEKFLFPEGSKITLDGGRVKTLKLRGAVSQGMIVDINDNLETLYPGVKNLKVGDDASKILNIIKFEPPVSSIPRGMNGTKVRKENPNFKEYLDVKAYKWYSNSGVFQDGETVFVSAKIHGTSVRAGWVPTHVPSIDWKLLFKNPEEFGIILLKNIKKKLNLLPKYEYVVGSRRVQLQDKGANHKGYYESNVHRDACEYYELRSKLAPGEVVYGEVFGHKIQKGYTYGMKEGQLGLVAFDVMVNGRYLPAQEFLSFCEDRKIPTVPNLGFIPYDLEEINKLAGAKVCMNGQKTREGVVIKSIDEKSHPACGRRVFKVINPDYLLKDQTDFH